MGGRALPTAVGCAGQALPQARRMGERRRQADASPARSVGQRDDRAARLSLPAAAAGRQAPDPGLPPGAQPSRYRTSSIYRRQPPGSPDICTSFRCSRTGGTTTRSIRRQSSSTGSRCPGARTASTPITACSPKYAAARLRPDRADRHRASAEITPRKAAKDSADVAFAAGPFDRTAAAISRAARDWRRADAPPARR